MSAGEREAGKGEGNDIEVRESQQQADLQGRVWEEGVGSEAREAGKHATADRKEPRYIQ